MTIETKYNIGDEVWFWFNHTALVGIIVNIVICSDMKVRYKCDDYYNILTEDELYFTKEELLKSL